MAAHVLNFIIPTSLLGLVGGIISLILGYNIAWCVFNYAFHRLRAFPGPFGCAISKLPTIYHLYKGDWNFWVTRLHEQYGDVVRLTPNELSFWGADAYKDIYGHKTSHARTLEKDPRFYKTIPGEAPAITSADFADHSRMRRVFSNAFSDRALKLQEPMFLTYVDALIAKLRAGVAQDPHRKWNMVRMYNFTTFDIMGDLTFGESLDMLANDDYHPWVSTIFESIKVGALIHVIRYFPAIEALLFRNLPASAKKGMVEHQNFSIQRVNRRLEKADARPDIWGLVLKRDGDSGLTRREMYSNASVFMVAGTETTATSLSGLTYLLLKNPACMQRLVDEIRSTFAHEDEITIEKLQAMRYLHACLEEGLRMYPPVPIGMPRVTPEGAPTVIDGKEVPAGGSVMVTNFAAFRNPDNFRDPYTFAPERWLPEVNAYVGDKKHAFQPFSLGPRGCLGKNMAYHEMRVILVKVLFNFDISLCEESEGWTDQKVFILWDKKPLIVRLQERKQ